MHKKTLGTLSFLALAFSWQHVHAADCSQLSAWSGSATYTQGSKVHHNNHAYTANYWTQNNDPTTHSAAWGHWTDNGVCDGSVSSSSSSTAHTSTSSSSSSIITSSSSSVTTGGNCPAFVAGTAYTAGTVVSNAGSNYTCVVAGWCASTATWAYEPGLGSYWDNAWSAGGSCSGGSSSVPSSSSSSSSSSVPSSSSSSSAPVGNSDFELVGYWENWHWPLLTPANVPNYTVLNISFPKINNDGSLTLTNADYTQNNPTPAQIAAAKAAGKKVMLSIGGAGTPLVLTSVTHENNFVNSIITIVNEWGLDGIDIDTESGLKTNPNALINEANPQYSADYLVRAIKRLKAHYGSNFLITMAPETAHTFGAILSNNWQGSINWGVYLPMINALRNEISWVQVQYYNTGSMPGISGQFYSSTTQDALVAWSEAMIEGFPIASTGVSYQGLPANKVVIGLPTSTTQSAAGSGYTQPAVVKAAVRCLRSGVCGSGYKPAKTYPNLKGVMGWSVNEDELTQYFFSNSVKACVLNNQCQ